MTEAIIAAVITGACAVIGNLIISNNAKKKDLVEEAKRQQAIDDKLAAIELKLDIHNGYAAKFSEIQTDIAVIKNKIETLEDK